VTAVVTWRRALPALLGALLVVCAALVIIGVSLERGAAHTDGGAVAGSSEQGESAEQRAAEGAAPRPGGQVETAETLLGVSLESPWTLAGMAVISVGLAVLVWRRPTRVVAVAVIVVAVGAGVLEVAEVVRQLSADRAGLAVLPMLNAVLRVAIVAGAVVLWRAARPDTVPSAR
jgi:hypothetical protein